MAATLSADMDNTDKVVGLLEDARAAGLRILPPDANTSDYMFQALDPKTVRYGLGALKGVGRGACEAVAEARQSGGPFRDLLDFCRRVDSTRMNRRVLEALVQSGALDGFGSNRASLMLQLPEALKATEQLAREREAGQSSLFGGGELPEVRIELPETGDWPLEQKLAGEREILGHYLSGHPIDPWKEELAALVGLHLGELERAWNERKDRRGEAQVALAGLVSAVRRRGDSQAFVQIEDGHGRLECAFFGETFGEFAPLLSRDRIVIIEGSLREDSFNGGFSLRARQCWDLHALCAQHGRRLSLAVDLRQGAWERLEPLLAAYRPGGTPLRLELCTADARGVLDLAGPLCVRSEHALLGALRAMPGVSAVHLALHRPWGNGSQR
jgi:DNA polymerase-3 subunit alpha